MVQPDSQQMTIWRMCIAYGTPKSTNTHSEYVTLVAFPLQQWLHERASMLRYTYCTLHVLLNVYPHMQECPYSCALAGSV